MEMTERVKKVVETFHTICKKNPNIEYHENVIFADNFPGYKSKYMTYDVRDLCSVTLMIESTRDGIYSKYGVYSHILHRCLDKELATKTIKKIRDGVSEVEIL